VFQEIIFLPLGSNNAPVDHILAAAAYGMTCSDAREPDITQMRLPSRDQYP
jgi:hypothetical protein